MLPFCSGLQDLVMAAYAFSRVKHKSPELMQAIGDAAMEVCAWVLRHDWLGQLGGWMGGWWVGWARGEGCVRG